MKSLLIVLVLALVAAPGCSRRESRRLQFLQNGIPVALASVSLLHGAAQNTNIQTGADRFMTMPNDYHGGLISIKVDFIGATIADGLPLDLPVGETIFDHTSNNTWTSHLHWHAFARWLLVPAADAGRWADRHD